MVQSLTGYYVWFSMAGANLCTQQQEKTSAPPFPVATQRF
jgi:hypothetical protein